MSVFTLASIAERVEGVLEGDGSVPVRGVAGLREAMEGDISFLANPRYARLVSETGAAAVLVAREYDEDAPCALIRVENPSAAFARISLLFAAPDPEYVPGVHPTAVVGDRVTLGKDVYVGPQCVVEEGASIGDRTQLIAHVYIGRNARIGADNRIYPNVTVREGTITGERVIIHSSAVIGSDGFGYDVDDKGVRTKIPQKGIVEIGNDAEIGAATTIDRARFGRTVIGRGVKIDNLAQIAHNVVIGDHAVIVSQVGISGSTVIGKHAILAGQTGVAGHLVIGDGVIAEGRSGITKDIPAGQMVYGYPAQPRARAARLHAHVQRLPELKERVAKLEARLKALEERGGYTIL